MLVGRHAVVRTLDSTDIEFARRLRNAPHVNAWFLDRHFISDFQQQQFFESLAGSRSRMFFVVESLADRTPRGIFMLQSIDHRNQRGAAGHFYVQDAEPLVIYDAFHLGCEYAFDYLNLNKLTAEILAGNVRALRFSESMGMSRVALHRQHVFTGGTLADVVELALFRDDFKHSPTRMVQFLRASRDAAPDESLPAVPPLPSEQ